MSLEIMCPLEAFQLLYCTGNDAKSTVKHLIFLHKFLVITSCHNVPLRRLLGPQHLWPFLPGLCSTIGPRIVWVSSSYIWFLITGLPTNHQVLRNNLDVSLTPMTYCLSSVPCAILISFHYFFLWTMIYFHSLSLYLANAANAKGRVVISR